MLHYGREVQPALLGAAGRWWRDLGEGDAFRAGAAVAAGIGQLVSLWQVPAILAASIGLGEPLRRWLTPRAGVADRSLLDILFGFGIGSLISQGLALAGVADAGLLRVSAAATVWLGLRTAIRMRAWRLWTPAGPGAVLPGVVTASALAVSWVMCRVPDLFEDAMAYHLAAPEQWLALRRIVAEPHNFAWHVMLGSEALSLPLLATGGIASAKIMTFVAACMLPVTVGRLGVAAGAGPVGAAWSAALIASAAFVPATCWGVKNDLLAALFGAAAAWGCLEVRRGSAVLLGATGWLLGSAVGVKTTAGLLLPALVVMMAAPGSRWRPGRGLVLAAVAAVVPAAGWALRNWLHLGNPAYPFLSGVFPTLAWGPEYLAGMEQTQHAFGSEGAFAVSRIPVIPRALLLDPSFGSPGMAIAFGLLMLSGVPALRAGLVAGFTVWAVTHRFPRYLAPFVPLVAAAAGPALDRLAGRPALARAFAALLIVPPVIAGTLAAPPPAWRVWLGQMTPEDFMASRLTTWNGIRAWVNATPGSGRMVLTGDERRLGFHRRVYSTAGPCQPVFWKLSREARDADRMRIAVRQRGISLVAHSYVAAEFRSLHWYRAHEWTATQLAVYREFVRRWLRPVHRSARMDYFNGGWVVYAVAPAPSSVGFPVWFLPQTEGRWKPLRDLLSGGRVAETPLEADRVLRPTRGVRQDEHIAAYALLATGRSRESLSLLSPGIADGFVGNGNLDVYAGALASTGDLDGAIRWQARACRWLATDASLAAFATYLGSRAKSVRAVKGDWRGALRDAEAAAMIRPEAWEFWSLAATSAARLERFPVALAHARRALALNPSHPGLAAMERDLEPLAHTTISR